MPIRNQIGRFDKCGEAETEGDQARKDKRAGTVFAGSLVSDDADTGLGGHLANLPAGLPPLLEACYCLVRLRSLN